MTDTAKETTLWKGKRIGSSTGSGKHPSGIQRCFNGHLTLYGRYERYTFFISNRVAKGSGLKIAQKLSNLLSDPEASNPN